MIHLNTMHSKASQNNWPMRNFTSMYQSINVSIYLFIHPSIYLSIYLFIYLFIFLSVIFYYFHDLTFQCPHAAMPCTSSAMPEYMGQCKLPDIAVSLLTLTLFASLQSILCCSLRIQYVCLHLFSPSTHLVSYSLTQFFSSVGPKIFDFMKIAR